MAMLNSQRVIDLLLKLAPPLRTDLKIPGQHCNILCKSHQDIISGAQQSLLPKLGYFRLDYGTSINMLLECLRVDSSMEEIGPIQFCEIQKSHEKSSTWCWIRLGKSIATSLLSMMVTSGKSFIRRGFLLKRFLIHVTHRIHGAGIYANIGGILMVNVTIYSIHGSHGLVSKMLQLQKH